MANIRVKLKDGQTFDYQDSYDGRSYHEVFDERYSYDIVRVTTNSFGPDLRMTVRQFHKHEVDDVRTL